MRVHARLQPPSVLRVAVVSLLMLVAFPAAASAAQYTVNDDSAAGGPPGSDCLSPDYPTITAALADPVVVNGDTLFVCSGNYGDTIVNKEVILLGAQAGNDARSRTFSILTESVVTGGFHVTASNVTIDGFTAQDASPAIGAGINVGGSTGHTFVNNIFQDNNIGIALINAPASTEAVIRHNLFDSNNGTGSASGTGIYGDATTNDVTIDENLFTNNQNVSVNLLGLVGGNTDVTLTENESDNAFLLANTENAVIRGNQILNSFTHGIQLDHVDDVVIEDNVLDPNIDGWSGVRVGFAGLGVSTNIQILGNNITGEKAAGPFLGSFGIRVGTGTYTGPMEIHHNRIFGNEVGISNEELAAALDAENNWWGCNTGPNTVGCDTKNGGNVDADPWLVLALDASPNAIHTGGEVSNLLASLRTNSDDVDVGPGFPDGLSVAFATDLASVNPASDDTDGGEAESTLTSGATAGTANVTATLDNGTAGDQVVISAPPVPPAPPAPPGDGGSAPPAGEPANLPGRCSNVQNGTAGPDRLFGGSFGDRIRGLGGADELVGGGGDDCLNGGADSDRLRAGRGNDRLVGGDGNDEMKAGTGNDVLRAADGKPDIVKCGPGRDRGTADDKDSLRGCEAVRTV